MKSKTAGGEPRWGYRYRVGGRGSRRVQRGGFQSERDAGEALERALERQPGQAGRRQPAAATNRETTVRVMGATRCGRLQAERVQRRARDVRRGDRFTTRGMDRPRTARHRPGCARRVCAARVSQRPTEVHQDRRQRPRRAVAGGRARGARAAARPCGYGAALPVLRGAYFDLHNFRTREWKPAQRAVGITPLRRVYDLRHTFATLALRAGISTFDLSRYMGASLTMIDRHYGHLARDGRDHAITSSTTTAGPAKPTSTRWTSRGHFSSAP